MTKGVQAAMLAHPQASLWKGQESGGLRVQELDGRELLRIGESIDLLAARMVTPSFFCSQAWLKALVLAGGGRLRLLVVRDAHESILGVLPLAEQGNALGGVDLRCWGEAFYPDPLGVICAAEQRAEVVKALADHLHSRAQADRILLRWFPEEELAALGFELGPATPAPYLPLPASFEEILRGFGKKKRYNMKSMVRKAQEAGLVFRRMESDEERQQALSSLFRLHRERARQRAIFSTFQGEKIEDFHRQLVAGAPAAQLFILEREGRAVAVLYGFRFANCFFYYQIAHDPEWGEWSPGSVLLYLTIEECCRQGLDEFNFLQGDETYKGIWTDQKRWLHQGVLYRPGMRARMFRALADTRKRVKNWVGRS